MRVIEQRCGYFRGTHKGAEIEIERDRGKFYIIVRAADGGALYDGWAPENVHTMIEAKREARRGAMLDRERVT